MTDWQNWNPPVLTDATTIEEDQAETVVVDEKRLIAPFKWREMFLVIFFLATCGYIGLLILEKYANGLSSVAIGGTAIGLAGWFLWLCRQSEPVLVRALRLFELSFQPQGVARQSDYSESLWLVYSCLSRFVFWSQWAIAFAIALSLTVAL